LIVIELIVVETDRGRILRKVFTEGRKSRALSRNRPHAEVKS